MLVKLFSNAVMGETVIENSIADVAYGYDDETMEEKFRSMVWAKASENISNLDARLVWEPEISAIYWERSYSDEEAPAVELEDVEDAINEAFEDAIREVEA